eukprot:TRINITY_DN11351_c0_g1_i2.p1 TRINITY_DN11351_c0_g1~~TRINITY_DN11351_c0_g1_i2.p1  ORF type:complete len:460 (-),score=87.29 TRINITY_DN11351_c0_g1_i2:27-1406(-)
MRRVLTRVPNAHCRPFCGGTINYEELLTSRAKSREPSPIREILPLTKIPGMISLGGGMPNPATFPFSGISFDLTDGTQIKLAPEAVEAALQYSSTSGLDDLNALLVEMQLAEHRPPPGAHSALSVTTGSQDALSKAFEALIEPGDSVLVESPTYSGALASLRPLGAQLIGVPTDQHGLDTQALSHVLQNWDTRAQGKKPRLVYTIPTGSNPTGVSLSESRRDDLYTIAQEHDLFLLEDDPYYYLQFGPRARSLWSRDTDGRVMRFDSYSKLISSGLRFGFVTGPEAIVERINLSTQACSLHPSGVSQALVLALLEHWRDLNGFEKHVERVCALYERQRDALLGAADQHLNGLAEWSSPKAGMFVWFKLNGVEDSFELIKTRAVEQKVLLVPGTAFMPNSEPSPCVRASYSTAKPEDMEEAMRRLSPVSYTHLRAHETPEHLVCRLLLEKKKIRMIKDKI